LAGWERSLVENRNIVVVSDVHWGARDSFDDEFLGFLQTFLKNNHTEHLVLLGDIVDFWRMTKEECLMLGRSLIQALEEVKSQKYATNIDYIVGNHDCSMKQIPDIENPPFNIQKQWFLEQGGNRYRFVHGHELEYWPALGLFNRAVCGFLVASGGTTLGKYLDILWTYFDREVMPGVKRRISELKTKTKADLFKLNPSELNELVELLYLKGLGPAEVQLLAGHMAKPPNERMMTPILGKSYFAAEAWYSMAGEEKELAGRESNQGSERYDPGEVYSHMVLGKKPAARPVSPKVALQNIIGPLVPQERQLLEQFGATRSVEGLSDFQNQWRLKDYVFQLLQSVLLLGSDVQKAPRSAKFLQTIVLRLLQADSYENYDDLLRKGVAEFTGIRRTDVAPIAPFPEETEYGLVKEIADLIPGDTGAILKRAESILGLQKNETLVYGHTHNPFSIPRLVNTGSWMRSARGKTKTYVVINGNGIDGPMEYP